MKTFFVKSIPIVSWSSDHALNFRPRTLTLCILCAGLTIFGIGDALLIASGAGNITTAGMNIFKTISGGDGGLYSRSLTPIA